MIEVAFDSSFKRVFKKFLKRNTKMEDEFWDCLKIFINNPYDGRLRTHKLSGDLKGLWSLA
jgi:mRNA-degrading endonuclease YafQ of YafQ-DinJ toxin-antitoxin module